MTLSEFREAVRLIYSADEHQTLALLCSAVIASRNIMAYDDLHTLVASWERILNRQAGLPDRPDLPSIYDDGLVK